VRRRIHAEGFRGLARRDTSPSYTGLAGVLQRWAGTAGPDDVPRGYILRSHGSNWGRPRELVTEADQLTHDKASVASVAAARIQHVGAHAHGLGYTQGW
jgi:purine nucleoside permease